MLSNFYLGQRSLYFGKYVFLAESKCRGYCRFFARVDLKRTKKRFFDFLIKDERLRYYTMPPKLPVIYSFKEFHFTRKTAKTNSRIDPGTSCERWKRQCKAGCLKMEKTNWQRRHACLIGNVGLETLTLSWNLARMMF